MSLIAMWWTRRPMRKLELWTLMVASLLIGFYVVTWLAYQVRTPIGWGSLVHHSQLVALPSVRPSFLSMEATARDAPQTDHQPMTSQCPLCPQCTFPPFNNDCSQVTTNTPAACQVDAIACVTDTRYGRIECLRNTSSGKVYMPSLFINELFEVYGEVRQENQVDVYNFWYSRVTLYDPQTTYEPSGPFLNFDHVSVEYRSKVRCVTASEGVPLTNQWDPVGYYYAITIAQYGLSHHAKGILQGNPQPTMIAWPSMALSEWETGYPSSSLAKVQLRVKGLNRRVLAFNSSETFNSSGPTLQIQTRNQSLVLDLFLYGAGGITVTIKTKQGTVGYLHYDHLPTHIRHGDDGHVFYGMNTKGKTPSWIHLARDLASDWWRAYPHSAFRSVLSLTLHGSGYLDNVTSSSSAHFEHLVQAADWLVWNQDAKGGWPTHVTIQTGPIHLTSGWYSAMGQGQAMSTLVRAFHSSGQQNYLDSAVKATYLFTVPSSKGGVLAKFLNASDWYEEYPTTPEGTFVLNGFIFSLFGLYDVMKTSQGDGALLAGKLWNNGLHSLKRMLGMFDSGTGSFYDLRHVTYNEQPNRARWDYHAVHVSLLKQLVAIDNDPIFTSTLDRWTSYFHGTRSKHN